MQRSPANEGRSQLSRSAGKFSAGNARSPAAQTLEAAGAQSRKVREDAELAETQRQQAVRTAQSQIDAAAANVTAARQARDVLQAEQQDPDYLADVYRAQIASAEAELTRLTDEADAQL